MTSTIRAALVTGGARIGAVVATTLAARGVDVAIVYRRSKDQADAAVAEIAALGRRGRAIQADLTDPAQCERVVTDAAEAFGRLDIVVNMASVYVATPFDQLAPGDWDDAMAVDLRASYLCARAAVPHMRRQGGGHIVNFTDWVAASGRPRYKGYLPYYVAKAGVIGLTQALALELAGDRILVNAVAPGPILPPPGLSDDEKRAVEAATPLGRWGGSESIAHAVAFLIETDFVTGEVIRVDGGRHVR